MKKILHIVVYVLLVIWQLPQIAVGIVILAYLRMHEKFTYEWPCRKWSVEFYHPKMRGAISLGVIEIFSKRYIVNHESTRRHEFGHTRQSRMLGPLYLIIIGIPSLLWAIWWNPDRGCSYYIFYTEKWADRLGGVIRT